SRHPVLGGAGSPLLRELKDEEAAHGTTTQPGRAGPVRHLYAGCAEHLSVPGAGRCPRGQPDPAHGGRGESMLLPHGKAAHLFAGHRAGGVAQGPPSTAHPDGTAVGTGGLPHHLRRARAPSTLPVTHHRRSRGTARRVAAPSSVSRTQALAPPTSESTPPR